MSTSKYTITLTKLINDFQLEEIYLPKSSDEILINTPEVIRPGLALAGFVEVFEPHRIQIFGVAEHRYLSNLSAEERAQKLDQFFGLKPVVVVLTSNLDVFDEFKKYSELHKVPFLRTSAAYISLFAL